jgi:hypothetical protein
MPPSPQLSQRSNLVRVRNWIWLIALVLFFALSVAAVLDHVLRSSYVRALSALFSRPLRRQASFFGGLHSAALSRAILRA